MFKSKEAKWEFNARYNYWADMHPCQSLIIIVGPYAITILLFFVVNNATLAVLFFSICTPWIIYFFMLRQNDVMKKFKYPMDNYDIRNYFMGKWIRRDPYRFVYFKKIDNFRADAHTFEIKKNFLNVSCKGDEWKPYHKLENIIIHEWHMDCSRLATQNEIEKYNLEAIEAKILLESGYNN